MAPLASPGAAPPPTWKPSVAPSRASGESLELSEQCGAADFRHMGTLKNTVFANSGLE